jgi:membrane protease YdiL (CAAX protease family)
LGFNLGRKRLAAGSLLVFASMVVLLVVPPGLFVAATFAATTCMILASLAVGGYRALYRPSPRSIASGLAVAALLYLTFIGGNLGIAALHPLGIGSSNENSIYSLIASPANPRYLQVLVLVFDAVGYESFFRGVIQRRLRTRVGGAAPFAAAAIDAAIHLLSFNPLWVVSTFIVDTAWGLNYRYTDDLTGNVVSHFVWDILIFVLFPIR